MSVDDGDLVLSGIYDWFKADFGDIDEGAFAHLGQRATPENANMPEGRDDFGDDYDRAPKAPGSQSP